MMLDFVAPKHYNSVEVKKRSIRRGDMDFVNLIGTEPERPRGHIVAIIGGGGKTTLLERLGDDLVSRGLRVILTTTTKMQNPPGVPLVLQDETQTFIASTRATLEKKGLVAVAKDYYKSRTNLLGINQGYVSELRRFADVIVVEADGCRQRSLKTHKEYEPVIPLMTTCTIIICGADVVGAQLSDKTVHRAQLFAEKWDLALNSILTPEIIARELLSSDSYLRHVPLKADITYYVNKADKNAIGAKLLAEHLMTKTSHPVYFGSLKKNTLTRVSTAHAT